MPPHVLFLPGAGGSAGFWKPLGDRLPRDWHQTFLGWPGLGDEPHDPAVRGLDDLVTLAAARIDGPCIVAAQSIGGIVGIRLALRHPDLVRGLVLAVTSAGIDLAPHQPSDWRADYCRAFPRAAAWILSARADHTPDLARITVPCLLIWGDADPISPVSVGEDLRRRLPRAELHVVAGGTHDLVRARHRAGAVVLVVGDDVWSLTHRLPASSPEIRLREFHFSRCARLSRSVGRSELP